MLNRVRFSAVAILIVCHAAIALSTFATRAHAAPLAAATAQTMPTVAIDGAGGMFTTWVDATGSVYANRLAPDGYVALGWPSEGVLVALGPCDHVSIVADGSGGAFVTWDRGSPYGDVGLRHLDRSGRVAALSIEVPRAAIRGSTNGTMDAQKHESGNAFPVMVADGAGGVLLAYQFSAQLYGNHIYVQRWSAGITPVWSSAVEVAVSWGVAYPVIASDGAQGAFVGWIDGYPTPHVYVNRVAASGVIAPGWAAGGMLLCSLPTAQVAPGIVPDGSGGALVAWADSRDATHDQVFGQRVTADGLTAWATDGICVCSKPSRFGPNEFGWYDAAAARHGTLVSDGAGGAFAAWVDDRDAAKNSADVYAQRITSGGTISAGWPIDGAAITAAQGDQLLPAIAADGLGGAYVAWQDGRNSPYWTLRSRHLDPSGQIDSNDGIVISATSDPASLPILASDGSNGAFMAWVDHADSLPSVLTAHLGPGGVEPKRQALAMNLSSDLNPARIGRTITLTATVQPATATGTVDFYEMGRRFASVALEGGVAAVQHLATTTGPRTLTATYTGDATFAPNSDYIVQQIIPLNRTILSLVADVNPTLVGRTIRLTATVQPATASGTVDFSGPGGHMATLALAGGVATMPYVLPQDPGQLVISATYSGDTANAVSSGSVDEYVYLRIPVRVALESTANPSTSLSVSFTADVAPAAAPGFVTFSDESGALASVPLVNGKATLPYRAATYRTHAITASYPGDSVYDTGGCSLAQQFAGRFTTMEVASSANPAGVGQTITLTATVAPAAASGSVSFSYCGNLLGSSALVNGVANFPWRCSGRSVGIVTADYSGDTTYSATWNQLPLQVLGPLSSTTLVTSASRSFEGALVKLTATVDPPTDSGTVTIYVDGVAFLTAPVAAGKATITTPALPVGDHTLVAEYTGPVYQSSRSADVSITVAPVTVPYLRVVSPNDGEVWNVGEPAEIRWDASNSSMVAQVSLFVSRTSSLPNWEMIAENVPNTGSYTWTVTGPGTNVGSNPAASALVAVVDNSGRAGSDESDFPFSIIDHPTPTIVTRLDAEPIDAGVRISWEFAEPALVASLELQRAPGDVGPWTHLDAEIRNEAGVSVAEDQSVEPGRTYWYRLLTTDNHGVPAMFGPLTVTARGPKEFSLSAAWPNPSRGPLTFEFSVPTATRVKLDLVDLMGREMTVLAEAAYPPGRYRVDWDGRTDRSKVPAGLYFLRFMAPSTRFVRRVTIVP